MGNWSAYHRNISKKITKVIVNEGVTSIAGGAFEYCYDLAEITLPDSLMTIGRDDFHIVML